MNALLQEIRQCTVCRPHLEHGVNPVLSAHRESKIAIIGQAPGRKVHESGVPWDDKSGERLREWLGVTDEDFYNPAQFALIPMGFCYPGKGRSGDLPPRPECAPLWHSTLFKQMRNIQLRILIGTYAQTFYLGDQRKKTLTETIRNFDEYQPQFFPLPHPSPRNNIWLKKNPWFTESIIPLLQTLVQRSLSG